MSIEFPPGALPYCVFADDTGRRRLGIGSGTDVVDLSAVALRAVDPGLVQVDRLNPLLGAGRRAWIDLREELIEAETAGTLDAARIDLDQVTLHLAWEVTDYVDFYSSRHHAENVGRLFRPGDPPLPENWLHLPAGYHGRSSTVVVDGTAVRRPCGQRRTGDGVVFGPSTALDFELEVGYVVGGETEPGEPIGVDAADEHLFGVVLVNDWSARDIQAWEYVPLGPFLGKSFATTVSAWVMPIEALADHRVPAPQQDPAPAAYLQASDPWTLQLDLEVWLRPGDGSALRISKVDSSRGLYWTPAQQLAHLTANGARVRPGDLFATGTVSDASDAGSLLELTRAGSEPIMVGDVPRTYLEDGDEVTMQGAAGSIPLGPASGTVRAASHPQMRR
ncbi:MAG: fumarylacetoacetate hydrolase family protein [Acidimicrobiia bacterium]|nr:fumarylacetoacetate hydrolase family protein [Acidimicrobiia bacterium]